MEIKSFKIRIIEIPFKSNFKHNLNESSLVHSIILETCLSNNIIGFGEAVPRSYVTGETVDSIALSLNNELPKILNTKFINFNEVMLFTQNIRMHLQNIKETDLCLIALVELSLLDAFSKHFKLSLFDFFNCNLANSITYSSVITDGSEENIINFLKMTKKLNINNVKLKISKDIDNSLQNIRLCNEILGDKINLRLDANSSFDLVSFEKLCREIHSNKLRIFSIEEPFEKGKISFYKNIILNQNLNNIKIFLDESVTTLSSAKIAIEHNFCHGFNLRVSKNGGISNLLQIGNLAFKHNLILQVGAQVGETSILTSAGALCSLNLQNIIFNEGAFGTYLLKEDLTDRSIMFSMKGELKIADFINGYGLGVQINQKKLDRYTLISTFIK